MSRFSRPIVRALRVRVLVGLAPAWALGACSAGPVHTAQTVAPAPVATVASAPAPAPPKPLTERERALVPALVKDVERLATQIGQRNVDHPWELADAADYLATEIEAAGYALDRQGYEVRGGKAVVQNLSATVSGANHATQSVIVAAYYDTSPGSRGADDNASGTALLLTLARSLRDEHPDRAIRFVFLVNEHAPFAGTPDMGSLRFAKQLAAAGDKVEATLALRAVGGSMLRAEAARSTGARRSNPAPQGVFVAGPAWAEPLSARVAQSLARDLNVTVAPSTSTEHPLAHDLGVWGFWRSGFPAVLVTRDPSGESSRSVTDADEPPLDYETMARLAVSLGALVLDLASSNEVDDVDDALARRGF